jgi:ATP-dependent DNA helicase PIF1
MNLQKYNELTAPEFVSHAAIRYDCETYLDSGLAIRPDVLATCRTMTQPMRDHEVRTLINGMQQSDRFVLKVGTVVMLTFNVSLAQGLCNGSMGMVTELSKGAGGEHSFLQVKVRFNNGLETYVAAIHYQSHEFPSICVSQIPLMMAWATTIHKSQGATLDAVQMDIGRNIFTDGQSYVALSRVRTLDGLFLTEFSKEKITANALVKDFYDHKVLRDHLMVLAEEEEDQQQQEECPAKEEVDNEVKIIPFDKFAYRS